MKKSGLFVQSTEISQTIQDKENPQACFYLNWNTQYRKNYQPGFRKVYGKKKNKNKKTIYLCSWRIVPIIQFNLFIKICYLSQASNFNHFTRCNFICYYGMFPTKFLPHDLTELVETDSRCSLWKLNRLSSWSLSLSSGVVSSPPTTLTVLWISSNLSSSISNCRSRIRLNTLMLVLPAVKPEII